MQSMGATLSVVGVVCFDHINQLDTKVTAAAEHWLQ